MVFDFKREKKYYATKVTPSIIEIPMMKFLSIDGKGDPNSSPTYFNAVRALYSVSYGIRMTHKSILEYVVPPLEGYWTTSDDFRGNGLPDKSKFEWTMMIRQPDFVTGDIVQNTLETVQKKHAEIDYENLKFMQYEEGLVAQILHIGAYDNEAVSIQALNHFIKESGYEPDFSSQRRHHEIYIGDPRRVPPEKLKTILRHPVKKEK
ncbi:GyrI-like domain-containing protein [Leuconostoc pseudomesenteroides]|uniref:GyrI-like domain-containing protein n=1 Tax=Leuconostoc pseudomesenteroides TaxID=33968 RepID=UPI00403D7791